MTVLRNELNQGYGGNQKIGYTFASSAGSTSWSCCTATASTRRRRCRG